MPSVHQSLVSLYSPEDARAGQYHEDAFFASTGADACHDGNHDFYSDGFDYLQILGFESFCSPEVYYTILVHELMHWTKCKTRLDREFGGKKWGDEGYIREELVAELGAVFLCADLVLQEAGGLYSRLA